MNRLLPENRPRWSPVVLLLCLILTVFPYTSEAQNEMRLTRRSFQWSFFPGISTNGIYSANYSNLFSFNLFGGVSGQTRGLEIGGITNVNTQSARWLQLAGLANIVGINAYQNMPTSAQFEAVKAGFNADMMGVQIAGILNFVRDRGRGAQVAGAFNFIGKDAKGLQIAGIGNGTGGIHFGWQLAGIYNLSVKGSNVQTALLTNLSGHEIRILQLATFNHTKRLLGIQIGLINSARETTGLQVGLINRGGKAQGTQIGLINLYRKGPYKENSGNNSPFGLVNMGAYGNHVRIYASELFLTTFEITTGTCSNCSSTKMQMPLEGDFKIMNQNALIFSYNPVQADQETMRWGAGYGYQKVFYNKVSSHPTRYARNLRHGNESKFGSVGIQLMHLSRDRVIQKALSLLAKVHTEYGMRFSPFYVFGGLSANTYLHRDIGITHRSVALASGGAKAFNYQVWLGYTLGIHCRL